MPTSAPHLLLCAAARDSALAELVSGRLRARGLAVDLGGELGPPTAPEGARRALAACDALLVVVSATGMRAPAVVAAYQDALARGKLVIPLLATLARDLPPDLQHVQAVNFSASSDDGWQALLIVLDAHDMARFPLPAVPELDPEIVLARLQTGRTPPAWMVSRTLTLGRRQLSRGTVYGAAFVLPMAVLGFFVADRSPLIPLLGIYFIYLLYTRLSPPIRSYDKRNGRAVVLTPEGILIKTEKGAVSASFHQTTLAPVSAGAAGGTLILRVSPGPGRQLQTMPIEKLLGQGMNTQQALGLYAQFAARYAPDRMLATTQLPRLTPAPLVFISYSRKDSALVDRLELTLRQCGFNPWLDRGDLIGGQEWPAELRQALDLCAAVVVVMSPDAARSVEVRREWATALAAGKPVVAMLAHATRRIPRELRPHMCADARGALLYGVLDLSRALAARGAAPVPLSAPPGGHLTTEPTLAIARALRGETPANGHVYRGRLPLRVYTAVVPLVVFTPLLIAFFMQTGALIFLWLLAMEAGTLGSALVFYASRRLRYPDMILTLPDGFIQFLGSGRVLEHPYASLVSMTVGRSSLRQGTPISYQVAGVKRPITVLMPGTLRGHRRIANEIAANYARYREGHAAVPVAVGAESDSAYGAIS